MSLAEENQVFDRVYAEFKELVKNLETTADNFMDFVVKAMEKVEEFAERTKDEIVIHGIQKKEIVEDMLRKIFDDLQVVPEHLEKIKVDLEVWLSKTIDVIVSASKGQLGFQKKVKEKCGCAPKANKNVRSDLIIGAPGSDSADVEKISMQVYDIVRDSITNKSFNAQNFIVLVTIVMQVVERAQTLSGAEKKYVAVSVIKRLVMEIPFPEGDKEAIAVIVETTLSKTIDYIIAAARGELHVDLQQVVKGFKALFPCCFKSTETQ